VVLGRISRASVGAGVRDLGIRRQFGGCLVAYPGTFGGIVVALVA
jgi:hypothetical protein